MGVHTGDSITVAPAQTLSDVEYQRMRDAAIAIIREIGVEAGGCNIQFAVNPENGDMLVVEMNPRVSRSSALASKATGFPIARVGAKLAVGYHLHELPNDITKTTPTSLEPALDYVVVKFPRFAFEKFPDVDDTLGVQMKAVGETMAIGRTFRSAWQKGLRGMEVRRIGWVTGKTPRDDGLDADDPEALLAAVRRPTTWRKYQLKRALEAGISIERLYRATSIDPWVPRPAGADHRAGALVRIPAGPRCGLDTADEARGVLRRAASRPCAGSTRPPSAQSAGSGGSGPRTTSSTPAPGSSPRRRPTTTPPTNRKTSPTPRIGARSSFWGAGRTGSGRGSSSTTAACRRCWRSGKTGFETIMVNSNPETVSTDFDVSDKLYFEPLTLEDVVEIVRAGAPRGGDRGSSAGRRR